MQVGLGEADQWLEYDSESQTLAKIRPDEFSPVGYHFVHVLLTNRNGHPGYESSEYQIKILVAGIECSVERLTF